jgi:hypothetical protein
LPTTTTPVSLTGLWCHSLQSKSLHKVAALEQHAHAAATAPKAAAQQGRKKRRQRDDDDHNDDNSHPFLVSNLLGVELEDFLGATLKDVRAEVDKAVAGGELPEDVPYEYTDSDSDYGYGSDSDDSYY